MFYYREKQYKAVGKFWNQGRLQSVFVDFLGPYMVLFRGYFWLCTQLLLEVLRDYIPCWELNSGPPHDKAHSLPTVLLLWPPSEQISVWIPTSHFIKHDTYVVYEHMWDLGVTSSSYTIKFLHSIGTIPESVLEFAPVGAWEILLSNWAFYMQCLHNGPFFSISRLTLFLGNNLSVCPWY